MMCNAESPEEYGIHEGFKASLICTKKPKHKGRHAAEGLAGQVFATWTDGGKFEQFLMPDGSEIPEEEG